MKLYMLLHGHHENPNGCPLSLGYQSLIERKREIKHYKPKGEQTIRLALIRNVKPQALPGGAQKARAAWDKTWAACDKTQDAWDKAQDAYDKARAAFFASLTPKQWEHWHKKICKHPDCKWTAEHPSIF